MALDPQIGSSGGGLYPASTQSRAEQPVGGNLLQGLSPIPFEGLLPTDGAAWASKQLLLSAGQNGVPSTVYWPSVVSTANLQRPLGRYYMFYSTDHDPGAGGIYLAYADNPRGPWTPYGLVYVDLAAGSSQTETPSVMWDPVAQGLRMFYQQIGARFGPSNSLAAVGPQSTLSAISVDGITWTKDPNFVLEIPALVDTHGDGHTGYFLPFTTPHGTFAYGLYGGGNGPDFVLWRPVPVAPTDVTTLGALSAWATDGITLGYELHLTAGSPLNGRRVEWNSCFVVSIRGVNYLLGRLSNFVSGTAPSDSLLICAPISADYRRLQARPAVIWQPTEPWESSDFRSVLPFIEDGVLYLYYTVGANRLGVISYVL